MSCLFRGTEVTQNEIDQFLVGLLCSYEPVFRGERDLHAGDAGGRHEPAGGAEAAADSAHAHRHPITRHVPEAARLRHEHHAQTHQLSGTATPCVECSHNHIHAKDLK